MKSRPILFSGPMVRAILDGRKSVTRRIVKPEPAQWASVFRPSPIATPGGSYGKVGQWIQFSADGHHIHGLGKCPAGQVGDRLWARETWGITFDPVGGGNTFTSNNSGTVRYRADYTLGGVIGPVPEKWKPSIFMPRWASRITLEVTGIRVERLQEITEADAKAEGAKRMAVYATKEGVGTVLEEYPEGTEPKTPDMLGRKMHPSYKTGFWHIWTRINGPGSWDANPWVWVIEFKKL